MFWRIIRSRGTIPVVLILVASGYWWLRPRPPQFMSVGYVGDRNVTLWNTLAQVRQPVAELHYGDRLELVRDEGTAAQVRTSAGILGWLLDSREMMDATLWEKSAALLSRARTLPVQARGRTKTVSNLRIEPGRNGQRVFQFARGTPVSVLERTVADDQQSNDENAADEKSSPGTDQKAKPEDWLLVIHGEDRVSSEGTSGDGTSGDGASGGAISGDGPSASAATVIRASGDPVSGGPRGGQPESPAAGLPAPPIAGWVLARFIEFDLPGPVRDYASSADLHVVAWFELDRVPDGSGGEAPQYLVAGSRGGEGQACDFTMLRVYTWGAARKRYETAYVESDLCGHLPIQVSRSSAGPEFRFAVADEKTVERTYVMRQTVVRRVKDKSSGPSLARGHSQKH